MTLAGSYLVRVGVASEHWLWWSTETTLLPILRRLSRFDNACCYSKAWLPCILSFICMALPTIDYVSKFYSAFDLLSQSLKCPPIVLWLDRHLSLSSLRLRFWLSVSGSIIDLSPASQNRRYWQGDWEFTLVLDAPPPSIMRSSTNLVRLFVRLSIS